MKRGKLAEKKRLGRCVMQRGAKEDAVFEGSIF